MASPNIVGLTAFISNSQDANASARFIDVYIQPRFLRMLHSGLPDPIDILSFGLEKTDLESLDSAVPIQKIHHQPKIHKT